MKGDMFHVSAVIHAKQLHSVATFLADRRAWNVDIKPVRQEKSGGGGKSFIEIGQERMSLVIKFLKANNASKPRDIRAYLSQNGHKVSNINDILNRAIKAGAVKKTSRGYVANG